MKKLSVIHLSLMMATSMILETKATKATSKTAKNVIKQKREDLFELLEGKVFRARPRSKLYVISLILGKKRMYYLQKEEDQIRTLELELGMEEIDHNFLTENMM